MISLNEGEVSIFGCMSFIFLLWSNISVILASTDSVWRYSIFKVGPMVSIFALKPGIELKLSSYVHLT